MILKTKRLILRPPRKSDWKDIVEGVEDLAVSKNTEKIPHPYSKKDALWWISNSLKELARKKSYTFVIKLKTEKRVIGCFGLEHIDRFIGTAGTGSWINKNYWRRGYITEAKIAGNDFAFNKLKLRKLNSSVFSDNIASNKTQQKMGYKLEGCKKKNTRSLATGKLKDVNLYGLFKEDWLKVRPKLIKSLNNKIK